jgi:general secretion pathway protein G
MRTRTRINRLARNSQRGMTLLEIMIVLAILALVMGLLVGPRVMRMFGESKEKIAKMTVDQYANSAFPQWQMKGSNKGCPDKLEDLGEFIDRKDTKDPWGNPYKMLCGPNLPPGVKNGIAIMSAGPDGKDGTEDDIKSWEDLK